MYRFYLFVLICLLWQATACTNCLYIVTRPKYLGFHKNRNLQLNFFYARKEPDNKQGMDGNWDVRKQNPDLE
jgi:hypothetical protein